MKEKKKFGLKSQGYVAPRATSIGFACDSCLLLAASIDTVATTDYEVVNEITWP